MVRAYLALGSNVGDRERAIAGAVERLSGLTGIEVVAVSGGYETEPVGGPVGQGKFINAAVGIDTELSARELVTATQAIETAMGRPAVRDRVKNGPRTLDIDLLLYGDEIIDEDDLEVPHPSMHVREFVLKPLAEIASDVLHPTINQRVEVLLEACRCKTGWAER